MSDRKEDGCKLCQCFPPGTVELSDGRVAPCEQLTGHCTCKPHVTGRNCDKCEEGYYHILSGEVFQSANRFVMYDNYCLPKLNNHIFFRDVRLAIAMLKDLTIVLAMPLLVNVNVDLVLLDNIVMHVFLINMDSVEKDASLVIVIISVLKTCNVTLVDNVQ